MKTLCMNVDRKRRYKAEKKARINERLLNDKRSLILKEEAKKKEEAAAEKKGGTTPGDPKVFQEDATKQSELKKNFEKE